MSRHFGNPGGARQLTGGTVNHRALSRSGEERDPFERFLHRSQFTQALLDIGAILAGFILVCATGIGVAAGLFFLLFCRF